MTTNPYYPSLVLVHECGKKPTNWVYETNRDGKVWCVSIMDVEPHGNLDLHYPGVVVCGWCGQKLQTYEEFAEENYEDPDEEGDG